VTTFVYVPFVASLVVAGLSRTAGRQVWPRAAAWATTIAAAALAASTVGALAVLACPVPAQVPVVAAVGRWRPGAISSHLPVPAWLSLLAVAALLGLAYRAARQGRLLIDDVRALVVAHRQLAGCRHGDLVVTTVDAPHAYALPGLGCRGAVVVSSGMLALLDDAERAAVLAHERSHLRHHHALFELVVRVAVALNPLVISLEHDVRFALERWADEDAAAATERPVAASALARAALGTLGATQPVRRFPRLALHSHWTTARVAALLDPPQRRVRPVWLLVVAAVLAALALGWALHDTERFFEAARLWSHR